MTSIHWISLAVLAAIAAMSAVCSLIFYKRTQTHINSESIRMTGAGATALGFFIIFVLGFIEIFGETNLMDCHNRSKYEKKLSEKVDKAVIELNSCSLHTGEYQCKSQADILLEACRELSLQY